MKKISILSAITLLVIISNAQNKTYKFFYEHGNRITGSMFYMLLENCNKKSTFRSLMSNKIYYMGAPKVKNGTGEKETQIDSIAAVKYMNAEAKKTDSINAKKAYDAKVMPIYSNKPQIIKDFERQNYFFKFRMQFYKDTNYVKLPIENFNWKLINETKIVGNQNCKKATCTWMDRNYTAWYCPAIPISDGPYKFCGLPGIILEISDEEEYIHFVCTAIETNESETSMIIPNITIDFETMKINANKALKKLDELNRGKTVLDPTCVTCPPETTTIKIKFIEREWNNTWFK